jgi:hypothetical protein
MALSAFFNFWAKLACAKNIKRKKMRFMVEIRFNLLVKLNGADGLVINF